MSGRELSAAASYAAIGLGQVVKAVRIALTIGLLVFGVWAALPTIMRGQASPVVAPAATSAATVPAAVASALTTVDNALSQARQSGKAVPLTISLTDQDLTRSAAAYFPQTYAGITVSSPSVRIATGQIVLTAQAQSFLINGPLTATATPYASGTHLLVRLDAATVNGITLPDLVRDQLAQQLQAAIDSQVPARLQVSTVTATQGTLTVSGTALPQ